MTVEDAAGVEFGYAGDGDGGLGGVEIDYFLGGFLECWVVLEDGMEGSWREVRRMME